MIPNRSSPPELDPQNWQVAEARAEVERRLPPAAVAFLRARAAAKEAGGRGGQAGGGLAAVAAPAADPAADPAAADPAAATSCSGPAAVTTSEGCWRPTPAPCPAAEEVPTTSSRFSTPPTPTAPASAPPPATLVRFSLDGAFVGLAPAGAPASALERDPLRHADTEGYTVGEACSLARSAVPAQRAAAADVLGTVWRATAHKPPPTSLPHDTAWPDVAHHVLTHAPLALRHALDDSSPAVVGAAAAAWARSQRTAPQEPLSPA